MKNPLYAKANPYDLNRQGGINREKCGNDNNRSNNPYDLNKAGLSRGNKE